MCLGSKNQSGRRLGGPPSGNGSGRWVGIMCMGGKGGEGTRQSKKGTLKWYKSQEEQLGRGNGGGSSGGWGWGSDPKDGKLWARHAWYQKLVNGGLHKWFRWVFMELDQHEPDCKWRKFAQHLTI